MTPIEQGDPMNALTYEEFAANAGEFFRRECDQAGIDNGVKALSLMWLRRRLDWSEREIHQSLIILELANKRAIGL